MEMRYRGLGAARSAVAFPVLMVAVLGASVAQAQKGGGMSSAAPLSQSALLDLPVKELTVFKDGHAFVLHEGVLPTSDGGQIVIDSLPTPILGTFWPYSAETGVKLRAVTAGTRKVSCARPVRSIADVLRANVGRTARVREHDGQDYTAKILGLPEPGEPEERSPARGQAVAAAADGTAALVKLQRMEGQRFVPVAQIRDLVFPEEASDQVMLVETRDLLTLQLDWGQAPAGREARVGMVYLQKGIRWIPNYRITIDGAGQARIELQATLINEMVDVENVTANLVIGVPSFRFADTVDPIAVQQALAQLSPYFQSQQRGGYQFSNMIQTQAARMGEYRGQQELETSASVEVGGDFAAFSRHEDLFIFPVHGVTLRKGERMVVPVAEFALGYEDVYTLDVPLLPPPDVRCNLPTQQQQELANLLNQPRVMHKLRLKNASRYPLTTAPALIFREDRLLAQSMMTYTAAGASTDLDVTAAVDIVVSKEEREDERIPGAAKWRNEELTRVRLSGVIGLTNRRGKAVTVEVTRFALGNVDSAGQDGKIVKTNMLEDSHPATARMREWWGWYNWPNWWNRFNGIGRITWTAALEPGQHVDLTYEWHYFWN